MTKISSLSEKILLKAYYGMKLDVELNEIIDFNLFDKFIFSENKKIENGKAFYDEIDFEDEISKFVSKISDNQLCIDHKYFEYDTLYRATILIYRFYKIIETSRKKPTNIRNVSEIEFLMNQNSHYIISYNASGTFIPSIYKKLDTSYDDKNPGNSSFISKLYANFRNFEFLNERIKNYFSNQLTLDFKEIIDEFIKSYKDSDTNPLIKLNPITSLKEIDNPTIIFEINIDNANIIEYNFDLCNSFVPISISIIDDKIGPETKINGTALANMNYCQLYAHFYYVENKNNENKLIDRNDIYMFPSNLIMVNGIPLIDYDNIKSFKFQNN